MHLRDLVPSSPNEEESVSFVDTVATVATALVVVEHAAERLVTGASECGVCWALDPGVITRSGWAQIPRSLQGLSPEGLGEVTVLQRLLRLGASPKLLSWVLMSIPLPSVGYRSITLLDGESPVAARPLESFRGAYLRREAAKGIGDDTVDVDLPAHEVTVGIDDLSVWFLSTRSEVRVAASGVNRADAVKLGVIYLPAVLRSGPEIRLPTASGRCSDAKLCIYPAGEGGGVALALAVVRFVNTLATAIYLVRAAVDGDTTAGVLALWGNLVMETLAMAGGWSLRRTKVKRWEQWLARADPFHAFLVAHPSDVTNARGIVVCESVGGILSIVFFSLLTGGLAAVLGAVPAVLGMAPVVSQGRSYADGLVLGSLGPYLCEFLFEIYVLWGAPGEVLRQVALATSIIETIELLW